MNRVKKILNVNLISTEKNIVKRTIRSAVVGLLGFVLSSAGASDGFAPFGIAYIPFGGVPGLIGVVLGTWINGEDVFRYIVASIVNHVSFVYLRNLLSIPHPITAFVTALWSVLTAGLLGLFTVRTSFTENCYFALTGVIAGVFSYVFLVYKNTLTERKGRRSSKTEYLCCLATVSVVIVSFSSLGNIWISATAILAYLSVFAVSASSGFLNSFAFSASVGFSLLISDVNNKVVLASLMFGALISAIVSPWGKYAVFASYAVSGVIASVYFRSDNLPYSQLFNIIAAGVIFLMLPKTVYKVITEVLIPQTDSRRKKIKKRKIKKNLPVKARIKNKKICSVCESCKHRFICWVKDYGYTSEVFEDFRQSVKRGEFSFPSHFVSKCPNTEKLSFELSSEILNRKGFKIEYSKCSEPKVGESVCGDSCSVFTSGDRQVICIADGMGTGPAAAKESRKSSKLIEDLMCKGVAKEDAIRVINETLIKSEYETVLAIDMSVLDLKTGVCEFVKAGAAPTFVIRNGSLYELGSKSVPVGILDEVKLEYERSRLLSGDVLLMVSDGMVSDGSDWLALLIRGMSDLELRSPLLLTSSIMTVAKHLKKNIMDDITVVAAKIMVDEAVSS
ncbi:MAG: hypothetical protein E7481_02155 [Ruminococcaceae bacterium]|nr:hypothetical protein [Oscillospiraceae bacterium]